MTDKFITVQIGRSTWQGLMSEAPVKNNPVADLPPMTVEEAAKVLMDQPYTVMRKAFDAMDKMQGEGADTIMAAALRALSGEKS